MSKVPQDQVCKFFQRYNKGEFPHYRLGQAFINHFDLGDACRASHENKEGSCLFYESNDGRAAKIIWEEWVDV